MRTHTPTSAVRIRRFVNAYDVLSAVFAGPIAFALRDQNAFAGDHLGPTLIYSSVGFAMGFLLLIAFHLGKPLNDYVSMRETQSVVTMSLTTAAITSFLVFSFTRLSFVPRSIPFI